MQIKGCDCSICNKLIKGNDYFVIGKKHVCSTCVETIRDMSESIELFDSDTGNVETNKVYSNHVFQRKPVEIKQLLDRYVVGQEKAKKVLSVACYNHYKRNTMNDKSIKKSNVLLVGPTGSGKTFLVEQLAKILEVPLVITVSTTLTEAGYIGDDVESVVKKLLDAAGGDVEKAEKGIIFIDEIDKLSSSFSDTEKKVGGKGVQQALLPLLEGTVVSVERQGSDGRNGFKVNVDTSGILFICGGAFPEAENIIKKRMHKGSSIGFNAVVDEQNSVDENILHNITNDDLRVFGLIPEFIGRLPVIATLDNLSVDMLKRIMVEPENSILSQYLKLMKFDNIDLFFEDSALDYIAQKAYRMGTGARSLRGILEELLLDIMFEVPSADDISSIEITRQYVEGNAPVRLVKKSLKVATF